MAKSVNFYQVFLSSRFGEFEALRNSIVDRKDVILSMHAEIDDLADNAARSAPPTVESVERAKVADVVILIIGDTYGTPPDGFDKSYIHMEFEAAKQSRILAYRASAPSSGLLQDPRLIALIAEVRAHCTLGELDVTDSNAAAEQVLIRLREELQELEDLAEQEPIVPLAGPLGREIFSTASNEWRNHQIGPLDRRVFGEPAERLKTAESVNLVGRSDDEWNEACSAYRLGSVDLTIEHLERALELRPLDGEARYWLARLELGAPREVATYRDVAEHAAAAAATLIENKKPGPAGLAHLVEAKAFRSQGDSENGLLAARQAVELFGENYFEPHLELGYLAAACGFPLEAFDATRAAFIISPPCLGPAKKQFRTIEGGTDLLDDCEKRLAVEVAGHVTSMHHFADHLYQHACDAADMTRLRRLQLNRRMDELRPTPKPPRRRGRRRGRPAETPAVPLAQSIEERQPKNFQPTEPRNYDSERPAGKPAELVRDGVSRASENLERLRDLEALLQDSASVVRDARRIQHFLLGRLNTRRQQFKRLLIAMAVGILAMVALRPVPVPFVMLGTLLATAAAGLAAAYFLRDWWNNHDELKAADRFVATFEEAWLEEANTFDEFVERYEQVHLVWRTYGPRSQFPDHVDRDGDVWLRVRRVSSNRLGGDSMVRDPLAPDFRELRSSIPIVSRPSAADPQPNFHLVGLVERRTKPPVQLPAGRWMAYRRAGTGPTRIDGASIVDNPWLGYS